MVESSAVPTAPPVCCMVLTIAEATPASARSTRYVAVNTAEPITIPIARPNTISGGRTLRWRRSRRW